MENAIIKVLRVEVLDPLKKEKEIYLFFCFLSALAQHKMEKVYNQFRLKYENREKHISEINHPLDPISHPLFSLYWYSN